MKQMELKAYSLISCYGKFYCNKCDDIRFKVIFHDTESDVWYCPSCLIKELNKPDEV